MTLPADQQLFGFLAEAVNWLNSLAYSWIPAGIIFWVLLCLRKKSLLIAPLCGFFLGITLANLAGELNAFAKGSLNLNSDDPAFFLFVGINEESVKFLSVLCGILIAKISYKNKSIREIVDNNWLAVSISGALGFAASENFIYGIDGEGGFARFIPLFAHCFFALFAAVGLRIGTLKRRLKDKFFWISFGLFQAVLLHFIYNCSLSEKVLTESLRVALWFIVPLLITVLFVHYWNIISELKRYSVPELQGLEESYENTEVIEITEEITTKETQEITKDESPLKNWAFSFGFPGLAHFSVRKEIFNGLVFVLLGLLVPMVCFFLSAEYFIHKYPQASVFKKHFVQALPVIFIICLASYIFVACWSGWESLQKSEISKGLDDTKRRLSSVFAVSTLLFLSLVISFFLPYYPKPSGDSNTLGQEDKKTIVKEIPMGLDWQIEEIVEQKEDKKDKKEKNQIEISKETDDTESAQKQNPEQESKNKKPDKNTDSKGLPTSQTTDINNMPTEEPQVGYIGIQISHIPIDSVLRPYVAYVYPGTSAERAGIQRNDLILEVNGYSSLGMTAFEISKIIRGPLGTKVQLKIMRLGEGEKTITAYRTGTVFEQQE